MLTKILLLSGILCFHGAIAMAQIPYQHKLNQLKHRYQKKLKNLKQKKSRMTDMQYQNSKSVLKNKCLDEQRKIDEKEKKRKAHIASKKAKSQQKQAKGNTDAQPTDVWEINARNTLEMPCDDVTIGE